MWVEAWKAKIIIPSQAKIMGQPDNAGRFVFSNDSAISPIYPKLRQ
jgi:hypothetical protein